MTQTERYRILKIQRDRQTDRDRESEVTEQTGTRKNRYRFRDRLTETERYGILKIRDRQTERILNI